VTRDLSRCVNIFKVLVKWKRWKAHDL